MERPKALYFAGSSFKKKTHKTRKQDLEIARQRLKQIRKK